MKSFITVLLGLAALLSLGACVSPQANDPLAPTEAMASESGYPIDDLGKGYAIFQRQCTQCHERRIPNEIPTKEWKHIVPGMAWSAGLSKEEERLVTEYIIAASRVKQPL
ncbi:c-type cytochrome [Rubritalea marina]|uniref:c-type cytochrome n=1 Tax=Rubritalea marina TaxID=361055 RepID=UPI000363F2A8|nr:cytochrome c [Rubritalea marina]